MYLSDNNMFILLLTLPLFLGMFPALTISCWTGPTLSLWLKKSSNSLLRQKCFYFQCLHLAALLLLPPLAPISIFWFFSPFTSLCHVCKYLSLINVLSVSFVTNKNSFQSSSLESGWEIANFYIKLRNLYSQIRLEVQESLVHKNSYLRVLMSLGL